MKTFMTAFIATAGLAVLSQSVFGQQVRQTPPEPTGRYYMASAPHLSATTAYATHQADPAPQPQPEPQADVSQQLAASVGCSSCSSCSSAGCCDCACDSCDHCCASKCCYGCCLHRTGVFGEFLYLSPRNIDMAYAVPQDGIGGIGTVPVGDVGVLDHDYSSGFRVGANLAIDCCSSFSMAFTWYETNVDDFISVAAPNVIQPLVIFPGTVNANSAQQGGASYSLDYQLADADYRAVLCSSNRYHINYLAGLRYAHMDQNFDSVFPFAPPDGTVGVQSEINFDGFGIRLGLEGERRIFANSGLSVYSKSAISALAGEMRSSYLQTNQFGANDVVRTAWNDDRVVTIAELELGVAWVSCNGRVRASAGYYFASWGNMVTTPEYVNAVQNRVYHDVSQDAEDDIAFDGLVTRLELTF